MLNDHCFVIAETFRVDRPSLTCKHIQDIGAYFANGDQIVRLGEPIAPLIVTLSIFCYPANSTEVMLREQ